MKTATIDLNADAGESDGAWTLGNDAALFPFLTSVNVTCGFHAGDPLTLMKTITQAQQHGLGIGAHPSSPALPGSGRRLLEASPDQVSADVLYQVSALGGMCRTAGVPLRHVKAHGALSTRAWTHAPTAAALARATSDFDLLLPLVVLPATLLESEARRLERPVIPETFPEHASDGRPAPRSMPGPSIHGPQEAARRALMLVKEGRVEAIGGGFFEFQLDTLCLHGDNPEAVPIAHAVRAAPEVSGVQVQPFAIPEVHV
ncbi:LamB/YcsF family protein [Deinococcus ruber]|uniref:UPF0271 protein n=1 Tax=Deinococcus ruber TaxID=1848197 RepID=A0A918FF36_9DEIO|nr:5-oxoprolinase subunit PxpA [Deinococcus ruber]GGR33868.1 UPF0271 protein [Deinococcus ruber]